MSSQEVGSCGPAKSAFTFDCDVWGDLLLEHVIPHLGVSDRRVFSNVERRTRALVKQDTVNGDLRLRPLRPRGSDSDDENHERGDERLRFYDFVDSVARLRWARDNGCYWGLEITVEAASRGNLGVLTWARAEIPPCPWDDETCEAAARKGHLEVLQWLRAEGCPWDAGVCKAAAEGGHLELLKWAREQQPPCPWDADTCANLAARGLIAMLRWAREGDHPCPWDAKACASAARRGDLDVLKWLRDPARDPPCPWNHTTCAAAAQAGHLEVLMWAREFPRCDWDTRTCCEHAASRGHLEVLKWVRPQPRREIAGIQHPRGDVIERLVIAAVEGGQVEVLEWLWLTGEVPQHVSDIVCYFAAFSGQLEVLKWARQQHPPCKWNESCCEGAAEYGQFEILKWLRDPARDPPCPWEFHTVIQYAHEGRHGEMYWWLEAQKEVEELLAEKEQEDWEKAERRRMYGESDSE
mmetsp:Transcript_37225/g.59765  ORF Transcript_37225/g.59765 Transcript_37225/m.59765 type:complete len:466 (+) Transcript_37225:494-1891(+)|eukprot:CAMPEP_0198702116 /NCGR_PEP_ID=MMETSP1468-20131203/388577_1 /TAXON_ID=1461545 /ORGANISM="Mantoniella sp, Strain CCMP1436" /LENGTH=465 /DNA_ID=CAMNT_0044460605 /DNA_START=223 /DNA_END=1620 /DNA_ORIENTATION=+